MMHFAKILNICLFLKEDKNIKASTGQFVVPNCISRSFFFCLFFAFLFLLSELPECYYTGMTSASCPLTDRSFGTLQLRPHERIKKILSISKFLWLHKQVVCVKLLFFQ